MGWESPECDFSQAPICPVESCSQDNPSLAPPPAKPRQLFGISMMDICDDDKLLNPILVGLTAVLRSPPEEGERAWEPKASPPNLSPNGSG